jgi:hypothetical protein
MLNQATDTATAHSWVPSSVWHRARFCEQNSAIGKLGDLLDDVPVMSATVLGLEILLNEPCIDLRMVSDLILSDLGATIHVLRLVGREYEAAAEHPSRMADCLAGLDANAWFEAISTRTFACDAEHAAITAFWTHCRLVAQYAQLVAESIEKVSPEEAYLVGLLHEVDELPRILGRKDATLETVESPLRAMEGSLPLFVLTAIHRMEDGCFPSPWRFILSEAHKLAGARFQCSLSSLSH